MEKNKFLLSLDEFLEVEPGTLRGTETLQSVESWNSLASIGFMALADERFGIRLLIRRISGCSTIEDLMRLIGGRTEQEART